ncbi:MAG: octanoyltransferase [Actinomycetota bacterium]
MNTRLIAPLDVRNLLGSLTEYEAAWELQREIHAEIVAGTRPSTLILVEHPPVFTAGKRTQPEDRPVDGTPVIDVDRGGRITWHGPGQLVGYPLVTLPSPVDVMDFVHRLEQAIMNVCASYGIPTERVADRTGVWVPADERGPARKIAAIGVRVAKGVTMHGFSLNCNNDLSWYERIVPCGIADAGVTTLSRELGREITIHDVEKQVTSEMISQLQGWAL